MTRRLRLFVVMGTVAMLGLVGFLYSSFHVTPQPDLVAAVVDRPNAALTAWATAPPGQRPAAQAVLAAVQGTDTALYALPVPYGLGYDLLACARAYTTVIYDLHHYVPTTDGRLQADIAAAIYSSAIVEADYATAF